MTADECLEAVLAAGPAFQRVVNAFVDEFRRSDAGGRARMVEAPITRSGQVEGLIAAVVSYLCREAGVPAPGWVAEVHSPEPFFPFPARSFALRVRLMVEAPAPFRIRNVFVPDTYMNRA